MFNRIRNQLRERNVPSQGNSSKATNEAEVNEQSGFICPICMSSLKSPEELQSHFEQAHSTPDPTDSLPKQSNVEPDTIKYDQPVQSTQLSSAHENNTHSLPQTNGDVDVLNKVSENAKPNLQYLSSIDDVSNLREEVNDLKASLNEEKWFSAELKKELENTTAKNEKLSDEHSVMQKQLDIALATNEELAKQKENLEKKAAQMAQTMAEIKSSHDEEMSLREATEERCRNQSVELEKAAAWVRDLESQLPTGVNLETFVRKQLQRPGADDVMVLKKELVSVQTLMDQMTQESEEKGKEVEKERERLQQMLDDAQAQAKLVQEEFDAYKTENALLKSKNEESAAEKNESLKQFEEEKKKLSEIYKEEQSTKKEELADLQNALEKEQAYSKSLEMETNRLQEEKLSMENDIERLSVQCTSLSQQCDEEREKLTDLSKRASDLEGMKSDAESNVTLANDEIIKLKEAQLIELNEKNARLMALSSERDDLSSQLSDVNAHVTSLEQNNHSLRGQMEDLRSSMKQSDDESMRLREQLELELSQVVIKLDKLQEDNKQLSNDKSQLNETVASLTKEHSEGRNSLQTQLLESERQMMTFKLKVSQLEEEGNQKSKELEEFRSRLSSLQSSHDEVQGKYQSISTDFTLKVQEIETLKERLQKSSMKLEEESLRREKASEEASKLVEERTLLLAKMEAGEGEAVLRVQLSDENEALRRQKEEAEEKLRAQVRQREAEVNELTMNNNEVTILLSTTQDRLQTAEETIVKLRDEVRFEHEKLVQAETEVKMKSDLLSSSEASTISQRADMESHLLTIKSTLEEKTKELDRVKMEVESGRSTQEELKVQLTELRQNHQLELSNIRSNFERSEKEKKEVVLECERRREENERMKDDNMRESEKRKEESREVESRHTERMINLQSLVDEANNELSRKVADLKKEESLRTRVEVELNKIKRQLQQTNDDNEKKQLKLDGALLSLEEVNKEVEDLKDKRRRLLGDVEARDAVLADLRSQEEKNSTELQRLTEEILTLRDEVKCKIVAIEQEQEMRVTSQKDHGDALSAIVEKDRSLEELRMKLDEVTKEKMDKEKSYFDDISSKGEMIETLQTHVEGYKQEIFNKQSLLESTRNRVETLEANLNKQLSQLEEHTTLLTDTEVELENSKTELSRVRSQLIEMEIKLSRLREDKEDLERKLKEESSSNSHVQNKLKSSEDICEQLREDLTRSKEQLGEVEIRLQSDSSEWEVQANKHTLEMEKLKNSLKTLSSELQRERQEKEEMRVDHEDAVVRMSREVVEKERVWSTERGIFEEKIHSLESTQGLLKSHKVELQSAIASLQLECEGLKQRAIDAEDGTRKVTKEKDGVITSIQSQLESKNRELESAEADRVVAESRLQLEIGTLSENLNSTRAEWISSTQRVEAMTRDNDDMRGQLVALNATIQQNNDERRALLERCLNAEQDAEQRSEKVNEFRRKLDDALSAMHELGRENQALQVKHKTTISRQWTDDRAATHCRGCSRTFSMTVRRHHCRHCGDIYCSDCSSRTATVAASKNPVRVCERCYDELLTAG